MSKKKFKVGDANQISLSYNIGSISVNIIDDDGVRSFVNEVAEEELKKLFIKLGQPTKEVTPSSNKKPLDIDLNVSLFPNPILFINRNKKNPLMFVPFPPHAPTLVTEKKHSVKFAKKYTFDDKEACIYEIALKCLKEGYQCKVRNSCPERYDVECVQSDCYWYIFTRRIKNCTKCKLILPKVRDVTRVYRPKDIAHDVNMEWNIYVSYKKAWRGKHIALASSQGYPIESFV
ncbi:hypothetical protein Tco_0961315 [Tanacetum coccineum]